MPPSDAHANAANANADALRDIGRLLPLAVAFKARLAAAKAAVEPASGSWYPYDILGSLWHLDDMLTGEHRDLAALIGADPVADIGGADGDLSFFLASLGVSCDLVDHGPSNFNALAGARRLHAHLQPSLPAPVAVHDLDLDGGVPLPRPRYGVAFFLGILYHLKNPLGVLEALARQAAHCFLSTRVARVAPDRRTRFEDLPIAYLVDPAECNADASNYWVFSPAGLERLFARAGFEVLDRLHRGDLVHSDPASAERDERAYFLLRSREAAPG